MAENINEMMEILAGGSPAEAAGVLDQLDAHRQETAFQHLCRNDIQRAGDVFFLLNEATQSELLCEFLLREAEGVAGEEVRESLVSVLNGRFPPIVEIETKSSFMISTPDSAGIEYYALLGERNGFMTSASKSVFEHPATARRTRLVMYKGKPYSYLARLGDQESIRVGINEGEIEWWVKTQGDRIKKTFSLSGPFQLFDNFTWHHFLQFFREFNGHSWEGTKTKVFVPSVGQTVEVVISREQMQSLRIAKKRIEARRYMINFIDKVILQAWVDATGHVVALQAEDQGVVAVNAASRYNFDVHGFSFLKEKSRALPPQK